MDDLWNRVRMLEGETLTATVRRQSFVVGPVGAKTVTITPQRAGTSRTIQRSVIENAWNLGLRVQEITPASLRDKIDSNDRNLSYIAAILKALHLQSRR